MLRKMVSRAFCLGVESPSGVQDQIFITSDSLLALASAVILVSQSRGTHNHVLLSQNRDSPTWRARSPEIRWPSYNPKQWVPFPSPPTTRRATMEVFEPASTRGSTTTRLPVYHQSVLLRDKPLDINDQSFFFQLNPCGRSPYVTSSLMRGFVRCLQFPLGLASAVILRSEFRGTHDHILLSQIRDSPNLEGQVLIFLSAGTEWPSYTPRPWLPSTPPPTTRRAIVKVFEPAYTWLNVSPSCSIGKHTMLITVN
jgi:hypothetical protein